MKAQGIFLVPACFNIVLRAMGATGDAARGSKATAVALVGVTRIIIATAISGTRMSTVSNDLSSSPGEVSKNHSSPGRISNPLGNMKASVLAIEPVWIKDRARLSIPVPACCYHSSLTPLSC